MVAMLLLKGLSTFEYGLRDKAITYEEVLMKDYDSSEGKSFIKALKNSKNKVGYMTIDLGDIDSTLSSIIIFNEELETRDSGYLEIKYRSDISPYTVVEFSWEDRLGEKHTLEKIPYKQSRFSSRKSVLIPLMDFSSLTIELDKNGSRELIARDSIARAKHHLGYIEIDYLKATAEITQKPLF